MKLYILLFLLMVQTTGVLKAQEYSKQFGKIGQSEVDLKQYSLDKDAEAVVLFDIGKSWFPYSTRGFDLIFERTTRIKILSEAGVKWANVEIPFYQEGNIYEKVYDIEAYAYNVDGNKLDKSKLDLSNIYDEKIDNSWNVKKFAIPNVKVGSIVEFTYKINSQYLFNLRDWEFQWKIPVIYSEYNVRMIPFYSYTWILQGRNSFDSKTSTEKKDVSREFARVAFHDMEHKFVMKDVPAFKSEDFITSINDYIIKLDFQLAKIFHPDGKIVNIISTWEDMSKEFLKNKDFGKYLKKSEKLGETIFAVEAIEAKTEEEKFDFVLNYVKKNYTWNGMNSKYASKSPKDFMKEKQGNAAEINLFTIGLLNAVGIEAHPLLMSTRKHGKILDDYPFTHFFDYAIIIANVGGKPVLSDATEILNLNNRIPSRCINDKGLVIEKDKLNWVELAFNLPSEIRTNIQIEITNEGVLNSSISKTATEYDALYYRNNYGENSEDIKRKLETTDYAIIDSSITVRNQLNIKKPYILSYKQTSKAELVNNKMYVSPFFNEVISENPLKQAERLYPIDITYPKKRIFTSLVSIPTDYQVDYLPKPQTIKNDLFEMTFSVLNVGDKVQVVMAYVFTKSVYPATDYSKVKYYFNELVNRGKEKIVFVRKSSGTR